MPYAYNPRTLCVLLCVIVKGLARSNRSASIYTDFYILHVRLDAGFATFACGGGLLKIESE